MALSHSFPAQFMSHSDIVEAMNDILNRLQEDNDSYPRDLREDCSRLLPRMRELTAALGEKAMQPAPKKARVRRKGGAA